MLKFFGFKNDGAKKSNDRETDGFVIIGKLFYFIKIFIIAYILFYFLSWLRM